jgi:hypothetical protein
MSASGRIWRRIWKYVSSQQGISIVSTCTFEKIPNHLFALQAALTAAQMYPVQYLIVICGYYMQVITSRVTEARREDINTFIVVASVPHSGNNRQVLCNLLAASFFMFPTPLDGRDIL